MAIQRNYPFVGTIEDAAKAIRTAYDYIYQLQALLAVVAETISGQAGSVVTTTGAVTLSVYTLTSASTEISSPGSITDGALLVVKIVQDATGGRQITWTADFVGTMVDIATDPNSISTFMFIGSSGKWVIVGLPNTGII